MPTIAIQSTRQQKAHTLTNTYTDPLAKMAEYKTIFFAIDKERNRYITIEDLERYIKENRMSPTVLQRWIRLFDPQGTGRITLESFCEILHEDMDDMLRQYPTTSVQQIQVIDREMSEVMMKGILNVTRHAVQSNPGNLQAQAAEIKTYADESYGDTWHCFIVNGSHGYFYSHKPNHSISFFFGGNYYFIFCTPLA
ncbi:tegumental antigen [Echinococcus multilocularis]|uniref:Tegumental antigen n=1 Tax=Echinococcus multilocularis TaxID=6211 RepID=A0A068XYU1_ECHMU|nr:tegumental antigen [Echinococcus multilocularis]